MLRSLSSLRKRGFTLIEILLSVAIFSIIIIAFVGILVAITQIQVQTSSTASVNQESQFLLQKIQYYVETASVINIPTSTPTSTLQFFAASSSLDPEYITLSGGRVYLQQTASGALQPLTSAKVTVSNLSFTRNANPPGHDAVNVSFTMAYNTLNTLQAFSQIFQSSVEHVSAATFDTGVYPSINGTEPLGGTGQTWSSINGIINFNGNYVGVGSGVLSPAEQLSVNGGVQLLYQSSTPSCNSTIRGTLWFVSPGGSTKDSLSLCAANASGTLGWQSIY